MGGDRVLGGIRTSKIAHNVECYAFGSVRLKLNWKGIHHWLRSATMLVVCVWFGVGAWGCGWIAGSDSTRRYCMNWILWTILFIIHNSIFWFDNMFDLWSNRLDGLWTVAEFVICATNCMAMTLSVCHQIQLCRSIDSDVRCACAITTQFEMGFE